MFSRWVFWDASGWVFYIDIFKSGNLEGSSPEREVSADRERRSCLSDSCCEASVIQGENSEGLPREIYSFHFLPPHGFIAVVPASFPLFCPAQVFLMFLVGCFSHQIQGGSEHWWNSLLGLNNYRLILHGFFLLSCWEQNSVSSTLQPLAILFTRLSISRNLKLVLWENLDMVPGSVFGASSQEFFGIQLPWCRAAEELFLHKEFWFSIALKIPSL